jgi:RecA-family ATPase
VRDFVPRGEVTLFAGEGGPNKSTAMLYLCSAVTRAQKSAPVEWMGQAVGGGRALFMSCEDPDAIIQRRLNRYCKEEGCTLDDLADLTFRSVIMHDTELAMPNLKTGKMEPTPLMFELIAHIKTTKPALVVLENTSDIFGGNENDRTQVRQFVRMLKQVAIEYSCAIVILSHPSKNKDYDYSGSTAWRGAVRAFLTVKCPNAGSDNCDPDARVIRADKMQLGKPGRFLKLRNHAGHIAYDTDGVTMKGSELTAFAEGVFMKLLREYNQQGRFQTETRVCATFSKDAGNEGVTKDMFGRAKDALFRKGAIELFEDGSPSRRTRYLREKE